MDQLLFKKKIGSLDVEVYIEDKEYSPEEERKLKAQFIYALTYDLADKQLRKVEEKSDN